MAALGEYLKMERELRGIDLQEIADRTNIKVMYLQAIESDSYELLPAEPFLKGFLRAYASTIGIDPEDVILRYKEDVSATTHDRLEISKTVLSARPAFSKRKVLIPATIIALGAIVVFALTGNFTKEKSRPTAKDGALSPSQVIGSPQGVLAQKGAAGASGELQKAAIIASPSEAEMQRETIIATDGLATAAQK